MDFFVRPLGQLLLWRAQPAPHPFALMAQLRVLGSTITSLRDWSSPRAEIGDKFLRCTGGRPLSGPPVYFMAKETTQPSSRQGLPSLYRPSVHRSRQRHYVTLCKPLRVHEYHPAL